MNIGIVCYPTYGGSGVVATELGKSLASNGHRVHFISFDTPFRLQRYDANIFFHEVNIESYPVFKHPPATLAITSKMIEIFHNESIDIFHVHYALPFSICAYLTKEIINQDKLKFITTLHGTDITIIGQAQSYYPVIQFGINQSDYVTSVSQHLKNSTIEIFKPIKEIEVIPNFVNPDIFKPAEDIIPSEIADEDDKIVIHVSNFRKVKNIEVLIKVYNEIQKKVKSKLLLIGDGPETTTAERLVKKFSIEDNVRFLGKVDCVEYLMGFGDLFLLPSRMESFGLALLEAMSCGVPTVSSNAGGITEVVDEGKTGFTYNPDDVEGMSAKSIEILTDDDLQKLLSENARKIVIEKFHKDKITKLYEHLYKRVLEE